MIPTFLGKVAWSSLLGALPSPLLTILSITAYSTLFVDGASTDTGAAEPNRDRGQFLG